MKRYVLFTILTLLASNNQLLSQSSDYTTSATFIENADLVGNYEIDTGRFIIMKYKHRFDVPGVNDEENERNIFIKLVSLDNLVLNKPYSLPDSTISISTFYWSPWSYSETKKITGTLTRIKASDSVQELSLHLYNINKKGKTDTLLDGIYLFKKDSNYFTRNPIEYNGKYDNLRIALKEPLKVRELDLSYANINKKKNLPSEIGKFKYLEVFDLTSLNLTYLPSEFSQLSNLRILEMGYNDFMAFPTEIFSCENLDSLNLELSQITEVPEGISKLKKLKKLNLDFNELRGFPLAVTNLPDLRELSINNGNIKTIPKEIGKLVNLEKLNFGNFWHYDRKNTCNNLEYLSQLSNLKELNLEWTKIKSLPPEFSQLNKLEILNIKYNNFKSFPKVIDQIQNLKLLIICYDEFDKNTMKELKMQNKKYKIQIDTY